MVLRIINGTKAKKPEKKHDLGETKPNEPTTIIEQTMFIYIPDWKKLKTRDSERGINYGNDTRGGNVIIFKTFFPPSGCAI